MSLNRTYDTWVKAILQWRPGERKTRVQNLAHLVTGIFESKSVHLSKVASKVVSTVNLPSVTRRLSRFLDNPAVRVREWYAPLARDLLQAAAQTVGEIRLLTDGTQIGNGHQLLMVALAYRRRAFPLAWTWVKLTKGHSSAHRQLALLKYVQGLLPAGVPVSLAGDSEFGAIPVLRQVEAWGWSYVLRQKKQHLVRRNAAGEWQKCGQLVNAPGQRTWQPHVALTRQHAYPTNVLAHWQVGQDKPWLLATNLPTANLAWRVYKRRMWIEELFGDLKRQGFDLASTHLQHVARLSRLTLAVALLYLWCLSLGSRLIKNGQRPWVDRADRRDLSLFQIGWRWLQRRLTNALSIRIPLCPIHFLKLSGS